MENPKIKLEPTAAFVMTLALGLFRENELTQKFVEQLDLSSGQDLIEDAKKVENLELTQELMCNRKFTVRHCLFDEIINSAEPVQIVILAAGKSPLSLEAVEAMPDKIKKYLRLMFLLLLKKKKFIFRFCL